MHYLTLSIILLCLVPSFGFNPWALMSPWLHSGGHQQKQQKPQQQGKKNSTNTSSDNLNTWLPKYLNYIQKNFGSGGGGGGGGAGGGGGK